MDLIAPDARHSERRRRQLLNTVRLHRALEEIERALDKGFEKVEQADAKRRLTRVRIGRAWINGAAQLAHRGASDTDRNRVAVDRVICVHHHAQPDRETIHALELASFQRTVASHQHNGSIELLVAA